MVRSLHLVFIVLTTTIFHGGLCLPVQNLESELGGLPETFGYQQGRIIAIPFNFGNKQTTPLSGLLQNDVNGLKSTTSNLQRGLRNVNTRLNNAIKGLFARPLG